jgi:hypothetical protein
MARPTPPLPTRTRFAPIFPTDYSFNSFDVLLIKEINKLVNNLNLSIANLKVVNEKLYRSDAIQTNT